MSKIYSEDHDGLAMIKVKFDSTQGLYEESGQGERETLKCCDAMDLKLIVDLKLLMCCNENQDEQEEYYVNI